jgi:predicted kinase
MPTITIFYGLCGSGKSHAAEALARQTGLALFEQPMGRNLYPVIAAWVRSGHSCIVEEAVFGCKANRDEFLRAIDPAPGVQVKWIAFENDVAAANDNVEARERTEVERLRRLNFSWSPNYSFADGCERRSIVRRIR